MGETFNPPFVGELGQAYGHRLLGRDDEAQRREGAAQQGASMWVVVKITVPFWGPEDNTAPKM